MSAEEGKYASTQLWANWRSPRPISYNFFQDELRMVHDKHSERLDIDAVYTFDLKIAQD